MPHAYHRTTRAVGDAILREGFRDAEGTYLTANLWRGVWVTIDRPWDPVIAGMPGDDDPALLVVEIPLDLFTRHEWVEDGKSYREALVPADELNRYPVWRAWECVECGAVAREESAGWESEVLGHPFRGTRERVSTCPRCVEETGR
jgi:hypothetical protein